MYSLLISSTRPFLPLVLNARVRAGREDPDRLDERYGIAQRPAPPGPLVWVHAASVGESLSVLPLIHRLMRGDPALSILVTTATVTAARLMEARLPPGAFHQYMPFDAPRYVARFLDHWRPALALWVESELWPTALSMLKKRGIPAILVNGRLSDRSFRRWSRLKGWIGDILSAFVLCLAQDDAEAARFAALGARNVRALGNLKYAALPPPADTTTLETLKTAMGDRPVWLMASTHEGEDSLAIEAHQALKKKFPDLLTILVPRHPARGDSIEALIVGEGLRLARRSMAAPPAPDTDIFIGDTMGEMGLFYRLAPITCVAGSFTWEGHNPIEVAQSGSAILFGPRMANFATIARDFLACGGACQVQDGAGLQAALERLLTVPEDRRALTEAAARLAMDKAGVLDTLWSAMTPWLPAAATRRRTSVDGA